MNTTTMSKSTHEPAKATLKVILAVTLLVALASILTLAPPVTQTTIALGFVAFWLAGAAATTAFLLYSSRQDSQNS